MEIGGLGAINTLVSKGTSPDSSASSTSGFASLFANLMGNPTVVNQTVSNDETLNNLSGEELVGLVQFLQTNDIFDLEEGTEIMGEASIQTNADIIKKIEEYLNLSPNDLLQLLSKINSELNTDDDENKLEGLPSENQEINQLELILSLIQSIISTQKQNLQVVPNKDFGQAMKAIKLFELLSAHQDSLENQLKLKEFMKSINEKLEMLLSSSNSSDKSDFAKTTFQALVKELNGKNTTGTEIVIENAAKDLNKTVIINHQGFTQFQQLSKPEQLTLLANHSNRPVSAEQLIEQFESILSKSQLMKNGGTQRLFIKLNPEHLGALRVELIQKDSAIIARILTSTSNAKDMMETHLNGLKQAFQSQNIQVERIEISQAFTQQERSFNREQHQGQEREQHKEEQQEKKPAEFNHTFEEALLNTEA